MTRAVLFDQIMQKQSYLCVGLDTDIDKIPRHLLSLEDPVFEFNRQIIDATNAYCVAYKPNIAFYQSLGSSGWESLQKTIDYIPKDIFTIADAKCGDIGNTSRLYAKAFFEKMGVDSVTVSPYMGKDSIVPFLDFENKWVILLAHTSNSGSQDFQILPIGERLLYQEVVLKSQQWATPDQIMYVVGATRADKIADIRKIARDHFFLVPGVGIQKGNLKEISKLGMNSHCGLLANASRAVIYASNGHDFAEKAGVSAKAIQQEMQECLEVYLPK